MSPWFNCGVHLLQDVAKFWKVGLADWGGWPYAVTEDPLVVIEGGWGFSLPSVSFLSENLGLVFIGFLGNYLFGGARVFIKCRSFPSMENVSVVF